MRKKWSKLTVYSLCGFFMIGGLSFLPQSRLQKEVKAQTNHAGSEISNTYLDQTAQDISKTVKSSGWQEDENGWRYRNTDGSFVKGGFSSSKGYWYYFDQDGYIVKGWQRVINDWYFFNQEGHMITGDIEIDGKHYCFEATGKLNKQYYNVD
jgi:glucan-binding YG repeat protein